jgi:hypothetical protein
MACGCYTCLFEEHQAKIKADRWIDLAIIIPMFTTPMLRMILCDLCGNKRCPHATDHRLACTESNASGQKGSRYE